MRTAVAFLFFTLYLSCEGTQDDHEQFNEINIPANLGLVLDRDNTIAEHKEKNVGYCFSSKRKSPINIDLGSVTTVNLPTLNFDGYDKSEKVSESHASNYSATMHGYANWTFQPTMSGGPLAGNYKLIEIYWDIMTANSYGLPPFTYGHAINNLQATFEVHLVHTKDGMSLDDAKNVSGGVVIVATMFRKQFTPTVQQEMMYNISHPEKAGEEFTWIYPKYFLTKDNQTYFVYNGSLAYPPCLGDVTWIVMANTITIGMNNLDHIFHSNRLSNISRHLSILSVSNKTSYQVLMNQRKIVVLDAAVSLPVAVDAANYISIVLGLLAAVLCAGIVVSAVYKIVEKRKKFSISNDSNNDVAFHNQNYISFVNGM